MSKQNEKTSPGCWVFTRGGLGPSLMPVELWKPCARGPFRRRCRLFRLTIADRAVAEQGLNVLIGRVGCFV
jgi:hypothetical protein